MTEFFKVTLAGLNIEIECLHRDIFHRCRHYLSHFDEPDLVIAVTKDEIIAHRKITEEDKPPMLGVALCPPDGQTEEDLIYEKLADSLLRRDTLFVHGAVVAKDSIAYMFTASSGVGKSTRAKLWLEEYPDSIVVNGDKPFIKITNTEAIACGSPWCGKEGWNTNTMSPLRAIFLLERAAEGEKNTIEEISLGKAFPFLLQQTYRSSNPDLMRKTIQLVKAMEGKVKFYKFCSTPTPEAIRLAYETARPK